MSTPEDKVYERIRCFLDKGNANVISGHPPSSKAYDTDLVRLPAPGRHAGRYHIDIIFAINGLLVLTELKGKSSESFSDIEKLRDIIGSYSRAELVRLIRIRTNRKDIDWSAIDKIIPAIGVEFCDTIYPDDFVTIIAGSDETIKFCVGNSVPDQKVVERYLSMAFGTE